MPIDRDGLPAPSPLAARRLLPLLVLAGLVAAAFAFRLDRYLGFEQLSANHDWLRAEVTRLGMAAPVLFALFYAVVTALSVPGGTVLTVFGGFLFGTASGTAAAVIGATLGATIIFAVARSGVGEPLRARAGPFIRKLEHGFRDNALSYLLVLRLVPLFPFWLVNLVPAFFGVSLPIFILATFLGIIPGCFVFAGLGNGLGRLLEEGSAPDLGIIFQPSILLPLIGLAMLALVPVAYKAWQRRAARGANG